MEDSYCNYEDLESLVAVDESKFILTESNELDDDDNCVEVFVDGTLIQAVCYEDFEKSDSFCYPSTSCVPNTDVIDSELRKCKEMDRRFITNSWDVAEEIDVTDSCILSADGLSRPTDTLPSETPRTPITPFICSLFFCWFTSS